MRLDLRVDKAISEGQLYRHYGLFVEDLPKDLVVFSAFVAVTHHSRVFYEIKFVTLEPKYQRLSANTLRHLAGVAEMRQLLKASRDAWRSDAHASFASEKPDAVWQSPVGAIAIEFDAGSYRAQKIDQKIQVFKAFGGQIWGSSSQKRFMYLSESLQDTKVIGQSLFVDWAKIS